MKDSNIPYSERELIQRAINNAGYVNTEPRWVCVKRIFRTGETVSRLICSRYGFDPDKEVAGLWEEEEM